MSLKQEEQEEFKFLVQSLFTESQQSDETFLIGMINASINFGLFDNKSKGVVSAYRASIWNILSLIKLFNLCPVESMVLHYKFGGYAADTYARMFHRALANLNLIYFVCVEHNRTTKLSECLGALLVNIDHLLRTYHNTSVFTEVLTIKKILDDGGVLDGKAKI